MALDLDAAMWVIARPIAQITNAVHFYPTLVNLFWYVPQLLCENKLSCTNLTYAMQFPHVQCFWKIKQLFHGRQVFLETS